nr:hypothetical protein [Sulfurospirillum sp. 'SP']
MSYIIFNVTDNPAFNFFFSFPVWTTIICIPMVLGLSALRYLK